MSEGGKGCQWKGGGGHCLLKGRYLMPNYCPCSMGLTIPRGKCTGFIVAPSIFENNVTLSHSKIMHRTKKKSDLHTCI